MTTHAHVQHAPQPPTAHEQALACWEDDGGPVLPLPPEEHSAEWLRISAALTARVPELADRDDIIVTCRPGALSGAPAAFYPAIAELEIDTAVFAPMPPSAIHPERHGDEDRYPTGWGALVHEAAHAAHTRWETPRELKGTALGIAAELLEESRVERAHLARRPTDRRYLRSLVGKFILGDSSGRQPTTVWEAAGSAGLILARRDAGILDPDETESFTQTITKVLGEDLLETLTGIWTAAHAIGDTDQQAMLDHARAWCDALGANSTQPPPVPSTGNTPEALPAGASGDLADAIGDVIATVAAHERAEAAADAKAKTAQAARAEAKAQRAARERQAADIANEVFTPGAGTVAPGDSKRRHRSPITGTRPPTGKEKAAAGQLARALRTAAHRERTATVTTSDVPPGRLHMRGALARDAQRAAGATPTAKPWRHTQRRHAPNPPLRVGIAVDVSGSMERATKPIASAAWIVAKATALTDPNSRSATIAYEAAVTAITAPGRTPTSVTEFQARGKGHDLAATIDALTSGLDLTKPEAARLLVIASDGIYTRDDRARAAARLTHLKQAGCAILWLTFHDESVPLPGTTVLELTDPAQAPAAIAKAATAALSAR